MFPFLQIVFAVRWESVLRASPVLSVFALAMLAGCGGSVQDEAASAPSASAGHAKSGPAPADTGSADPLMVQVNARAPYAGEWAAEHSHCDDEQKKWTIEPHRMAIVPAMRFCAFESVYVNQAADAGETSWSAGATCLAEGRESHDFLFFRVKENLREMRVTFNDSRSVQLYRCIS